MYKQNLSLNNPQGLICKIIKPIWIIIFCKQLYISLYLNTNKLHKFICFLLFLPKTNIFQEDLSDPSMEPMQVLPPGIWMVWLVGWIYGISTFVGKLMPNSFLYNKSVLFQTIQFRMSTQFNCQKHFYLKLFSLFKKLYITIQFSVSTVSMSKTVQFHTIQFSINKQFKCNYSLIVKIFLFLAIQFSQAVLIQLIQFSISIDFVYTQLNVKTVLC